MHIYIYIHINIYIYAYTYTYTYRQTDRHMPTRSACRGDGDAAVTLVA